MNFSFRQCIFRLCRCYFVLFDIFHFCFFIFFFKSWCIFMRTALKSSTITQHDVFMFHPCCSVCQNVIPFYGYIMFHAVNFVHHLLVDIWMFPFWLLWLMLLQTCLQVSVWICVFTSLGSVPKSRLAALCTSSGFTLLRNSQVVFHSSCTVLHLTFTNHWVLLPFTVYKGSIFSTSSPTLVIVHLLLYLFILCGCTGS